MIFSEFITKKHLKQVVSYFLQVFFYCLSFENTCPILPSITKLA